MGLERIITTDMSANIVAGLRKRRWTLKRIARVIDAPVVFVEGVVAKKQVLTVADIEALAAQTGLTAPLMILDSITDLPPHARPLFDLTRKSLRASARLRDSLRQRKRGRHRARSTAA